MAGKASHLGGRHGLSSTANIAIFKNDNDVYSSRVIDIRLRTMQNEIDTINI